MTSFQRRLLRDEMERKKRMHRAIRRANSLMNGKKEHWWDRIEWPGVIMITLAAIIAIFIIWNV